MKKTTDYPKLDVADFTGGWNPSMTPLMLSDGSKKPMQSPDLLNCDFNNRGAVEKRLGKTKQGTSLGGTSLYLDQSSNNSTRNTASAAYPTYTFASVCGKFTAPSSNTVAQASVNIGVNVANLFTSVRLTIRNDAAGSPGSLVTNGTSNSFNGLLNISSPTLIALNFPNPPSLTGAAVYWLCVEMSSNGAQTSASWSTRRDTGFVVATDVKTTFDNYATFSSDGGLGRLAFTLLAGSPATQFLYDYRAGTSGVTQSIMAANNGILYYQTGGTWTSLKTGLASGQDQLWDGATAANYLYTCDYGVNRNQVWDQSSTSTMAHGYRLSASYVSAGVPRAATISTIVGNVITLMANQPASGLYKGKVLNLSGGATAFSEQVTIQTFATTGTAGSATYYVTTITCVEAPKASDRTTVMWNGVTTAFTAAGGAITVPASPVSCIKIMAVTKLTSGGFRASEEISLDMTAGAARVINITGVEMNSSVNGTQYAFDIPAGATVWYMTGFFNPTLEITDPASGFAQIYRRIPTTALSTALNPMTNATVAFNITALATATDNTLLTDYNLEQSFFTNQIGAPRAKFLKVWQGFLVSAGDPNNLSRLWITPLNMPNVYGTSGATLGAYLDIPVNKNDGEIITGLYVWRGDLFVFKNNSVYRILFTGNLGLSPFYVEPLQSEVGCLSHWTLRDVDFGILFLSHKGPSVCTGTQVKVLPEVQNIQGMFQAVDPDSFNLGAMLFSTSLIYQSKNQVWWGVATNGATIRNQVLIYDYSKRIFWLADGINANYFQTIGDTNGFPQPWSGDNSGQIFRHDLGTNDNGAAINWIFSTPNLPMGDIFGRHMGRWIWLSGALQTSGTLFIDEYADFSTNATMTYSIDMTNANFPRGIGVPLGTISNYSRFVLRNGELNVPVRLEALRVMFDPLGIRQ